MITVSQPPRLTPLDEQTFNNLSQMIKAALPYMQPEAARPMALAARFIELQNTIQQLKPAKLKACGITSRRPSPEEMLTDLRKYCDGNEGAMIDRLLNILKLGHFYEKFRDMENNPALKHLLDAMKPDGSHDSSHDPNGGDPMQPSQQLDQILKHIPPDVQKTLNPEMLKSFDINKFNQLMQAWNSQSSQTSGSPRSASPPPQEHISGAQTAHSSEEQLKSLLTPEQLALFESLRSTLKK